jgi:ankyrin repeat protein
MHSVCPKYVTYICQEGDVTTLQRVFSHDPTQWRSSTGESLLHMAVRVPHLPVLDWLLTFPMDVNGRSARGITPLMWACVHRQEAMVRRLLDHGADLQATDEEGRTALHWVCSHQWTDGVAWLLEQGADPDARDIWKRLPEDGLNWFKPCHTPLRALLDAARQGCGLK